MSHSTEIKKRGRKITVLRLLYGVLCVVGGATLNGIAFGNGSLIKSPVGWDTHRIFGQMKSDETGPGQAEQYEDE